MKKLLSLLLSMTMIFSYAPVVNAKEDLSSNTIPLQVLDVEDDDEDGEVDGWPEMNIDYLLVGDIYQIENISTKLCDYQFDSSDTSVATIDANGKITAVGEGDVQITCITTFKEDGYEDVEVCTIHVYAKDYRTIQLGENEVVANENIEDDDGNCVSTPMFKFVPETTGYYEITLEDFNFETEVFTTSHVDYSELFQDINGDSICLLKAGEAYYFRILSDEEMTVITTLTISKADDKVVTLPEDGVITNFEDYYIYVPDTTGVYYFDYTPGFDSWTYLDVYILKDDELIDITNDQDEYQMKAGVQYLLYLNVDSEEEIPVDASIQLYIEDVTSSVKAIKEGTTTISKAQFFTFTPATSYYYNFTSSKKAENYINITDDTGECLYSIGEDACTNVGSCYLKAGVTYTMLIDFSKSSKLTISKAKATKPLVKNACDGIKVAYLEDYSMQNYYDTEGYTMDVYYGTSSKTCSKYHVDLADLEDSCVYDTDDDYEFLDGGVLKTGVKNGTTYYFTIKILDENGTPVTNTSSYSSIKYLTAPATKVENTSTGVKVSWSKNSKAKGYYVYRYNENDDEPTKIKTIKSYKTTSYTDTKPKNGDYYAYYVIAYNGSTKSSVENEAVIERLTPVKITSYANSVPGELTITWSSNSVANLYELTYSTSKSFKNAVTVETDDTMTTLTDLIKGKTYYFKVRSKLTMDTVFGDMTLGISTYSSYKYKKITK